MKILFTKAATISVFPLKEDHAAMIGFAEGHLVEVMEVITQQDGLLSIVFTNGDIAFDVDKELITIRLG